jgi:hypothetical protein
MMAQSRSPPANDCTSLIFPVSCSFLSFFIFPVFSFWPLSFSFWALRGRSPPSSPVDPPLALPLSFYQFVIKSTIYSPIGVKEIPVQHICWAVAAQKAKTLWVLVSATSVAWIWICILHEFSYMPLWSRLLVRICLQTRIPWPSFVFLWAEFKHNCNYLLPLQYSMYLVIPPVWAAVRNHQITEQRH